MKKFLFTIIVSLVLVGVLVFSQHLFAKSNSIFLTGAVSSEIIDHFKTKDLLIKYFDPSDKLRGAEKVIKVPLEGGKFRVQLDIEKTAYLSFWSENEEDDFRMYPIQFPQILYNVDEVYLFEKGDSVRVYIGKNGHMGFSGKGAEKLRLQNYIYNLPSPFLTLEKRIRELKVSGRIAMAQALEQKAVSSGMELRKVLVESYKNQISDFASQLILHDALALAEFERLKYSPLAEAESKKDLLEHFLTDTTYGSSSAFYPEALILKEQKAFSNNSLKTFSTEDVLNFWEKLKQKYSRALLDRLTLLLAEKSNSEAVKPLIDRFIATMQEDRNKASLKQWKETVFAKVFPFEFEDAEEKVHSLDDYSGKVIVMDFWFTGCSACKNLNAAMHSIIRKYHGNENIVFISVSSDKDLDLWIKSMATGKYTDPYAINLYTNGLGFKHPMLKHYNIQGAPRQFIISKDGAMASTNPPRPDVGDKQLIPMKMDNSTESQEENAKIIMRNPNAQLFIDILEAELKK